MSLRRARTGAAALMLGLVVLLAQSMGGVAWAGRAQSEALLRKGQAAIQAHEFTQAILPLERAVDADPTYDVPKSQLADLWEVFGSYEKAARLMQDCTRLRPNYPDYWYRLGKYLYLTRPPQLDQATSALKHSLALQPHNHKALFMLAQIQYEKKDLAGAEKTFQQALAIDSGNLTYKFWIARIDYERGKMDKARGELESILVKVKKTKQPPYDKVQALLTRIDQEKSSASLRRLVFIAVPGLLVVVVGIVGFAMLRGKRGSSDRMDLPADAGTYEEIAAMALRRLCTMTQMTYGLLYVANLEGSELFPKATVVIDPDELKPIAMDTNELPRWIERNDGKPFLFNVEKKEGVFIKAFPDARDLLEPMEIRIGVPFIFQERMLGIAFLGVEKTKDILRLKKLYERSQMDIYRMSVEVASALFRVYEGELAYMDLTTRFRSRKYVEENLPRALVGAEDGGRKGVVMVFEYDQYRAIEEQYGEGQADQILGMIADELRNVVPPDDGILARFEGGRFFAFMPVYTADQGQAAAQKVHDRLCQTRISRNLPSPTASVGAAMFPEHGRKSDDLIWAAERVMMGIHAAGGNQVGMVEAEGAEGAAPRIQAPLPPGAPGAFPAPPAFPGVPASPAARPFPGAPAPAVEPPPAGPLRVPGFSGAGPIGPRPRGGDEAAAATAPGGAPPFPGTPPPEAPRPLQKPPGSTQEGPAPFIPGFSGGPRPPARPAYIPPTTPPAEAPAAASTAAEEAAPPGERRVVSPGRVPSWMKAGTDGAAPPPPRPVAAPPPASSDTAPPPPVARPRPPVAVPGFAGGGLTPPAPAEAPAAASAPPEVPPRVPGLDLTATPTGKATWNAPTSPPARPGEMPPATEEADASVANAPRPGRGLLSRPSGGRGLFGRKPAESEGGAEPGAAASPTAPVLPSLSSMGAGTGARNAAPPPAVEYPRDELTGFVTASHMEEAIARTVDHAYEAQEPCSLLYFSLDRYGEIRERMGGEKTDGVVHEVTSLINDFLKEGTDVPGRWGDEGFAIVLPRTSSRIACNLAEQIRFTVSNLSFPGLDGNTTLSLGIASYPEQAHSPQELLKFAREASQKAQQDGGNTMQVYGAADSPKAG